MIQFFIELYDLEEIEFSRSLWPREDVYGKPELIMFSDGSIVAFGTVAYVRWKTPSGFESCILAAKSRIAPRRIVDIV